VPELALDDWLEDLARGFSELHHNAVADRPHVAWLGATTFTRGEPLPDVMSRADAMVQSSESQQVPYRLTNAMESDHAIPTAQWRVHIERALDTGLVSLAFFPVLCADGSVLHREAVVRVTLADGAVMNGARVVPPALRTGRIMDLDLRVVELALVELKAHPEASDVAVNVSPQSLARPMFVERLRAVLTQAGSVASRLWIEVDELILENGVDELTTLAALLNAHGTRLGLDHFQSQWAQVFELPERGISFVKLDASLCQGMAARLAQSDGGRDHAGVLRTLLGGTYACHVIATGLKLSADVAAVWQRELDAATGPELTRQWAAQGDPVREPKLRPTSKTTTDTTTEKVEY
jgi:EAL domain-containing protein (putative c-di-GMP-specific phosphodiesterase class I)